MEKEGQNKEWMAEGKREGRQAASRPYMRQAYRHIQTDRLRIKQVLAGRQRGRQPARQTDRQTDTQTDRQLNKQTNRKAARFTVRQADRQTGR